MREVRRRNYGGVLRHRGVVANVLAVREAGGRGELESQGPSRPCFREGLGFLARLWARQGLYHDGPIPPVSRGHHGPGFILDLHGSIRGAVSPKGLFGGALYCIPALNDTILRRVVAMPNDEVCFLVHAARVAG
jgi:hypothetical protein